MGDWLPDRDKAEQTVYQPSTEPDQHKPETSKTARKRASKRASIPPREPTKGEDISVQSAVDEASTPAPPPAKPRAPRVQFNHRMLADRDDLLQSYKQAHNTTMQAIVDQMVDEYLTRRGLLPTDQNS